MTGRKYFVQRGIPAYYVRVCTYTRVYTANKKLYFYVMPTAPAICLHFGKPIKSGRSDKKFCDTGCKDVYYNEIKIREHKEIKKIDTILKKNRRILKKLYDPKNVENSFPVNY